MTNQQVACRWCTTHVCGHVLCFILLLGLIHNWDMSGTYSGNPYGQNSWKAVQLLPGCYLHRMMAPFIPLAVKEPKLRQIRKYARLKAYNLPWDCDCLQTDIRQILVRTPTYSTKFLCGTVVATPKFIVAPSLHYHLSVAPSPQYHILVWPPPYISKF